MITMLTPENVEFFDDGYYKRFSVPSTRFQLRFECIQFPDSYCVLYCYKYFEKRFVGILVNPVSLDVIFEYLNSFFGTDKYIDNVNS